MFCAGNGLVFLVTFFYVIIMFCIVQQDIGYLPDVSQPKQFCILASILNPEHVARSGSGTSQESDPEVTVLAHPQH